MPRLWAGGGGGGGAGTSDGAGSSLLSTTAPPPCSTNCGSGVAIGRGDGASAFPSSLLVLLLLPGSASRTASSSSALPSEGDAAHEPRSRSENVEDSSRAEYATRMRREMRRTSGTRADAKAAILGTNRLPDFWNAT